VFVDSGGHKEACVRCDGQWCNLANTIEASVRVLTTLENMEISGNLLILENSGNLKYSQGVLVFQMLLFVMQSVTQQANM